jgi:hypothetical protein
MQTEHVAQPQPPEVDHHHDGQPIRRLPPVSTLIGDTYIARALDVNDVAVAMDWLGPIITKGATEALTTEEILNAIQAYESEGDDVVWPQRAMQNPEPGSIFLFSKRVCQNFRGDGHGFDSRRGCTMGFMHVQDTILPCLIGPSILKRAYVVLPRSLHVDSRSPPHSFF